MGSPEPPVLWGPAVQAGQSHLPTQGTLLSWGEGSWRSQGSLKTGSVHGGAQFGAAGAECAYTAGVSHGWVGVHEWVHPCSCAYRVCVLGCTHM